MGKGAAGHKAPKSLGMVQITGNSAGMSGEDTTENTVDGCSLRGTV